MHSAPCGKLVTCDMLLRGDMFRIEGIVVGAAISIYRGQCQ